MGPKTFSLPFRIAFDTKIIESSLTNGDDTGGICQRDEFIHRRFPHVLIVGVNADRAKQVLMTRNDRTQARQVF
jgi:hypothetical protein